jgi:hypothetical protein
MIFFSLIEEQTLVREAVRDVAATELRQRPPTFIPPVAREISCQ